MIETPRLLLYRPTNDDMLILENLWRDEMVRKFLGGIISDDRIKQKVVELQNYWDQYQFGQCAVFDKTAKKIIGLCGLHHCEDFKDGIELCYMFFPEFWKKGFAREAAKACIDYGFHTIKLKQIIAITQEANIKSCQLLQTIGMEYIRNFELFNAQQCMYTIDNKLSCISIDKFITDEIPIIVSAFNQIGWNKPPSLFEEYLKEQEGGQRLIWVAHAKGEFAGYVTLKWQSQYPPFEAQNIPEIRDLNVLPHYRKMGIGSLLLDAAEKEALTKSQIIGIGVGLYAGADVSLRSNELRPDYSGYGAAQRLYIKRGYIPDGKGVTYNYEPTIPGNSYPLDDALVLWSTKKLK